MKGNKMVDRLLGRNKNGRAEIGDNGQTMEQSTGYEGRGVIKSKKAWIVEVKSENVGQPYNSRSEKGIRSTTNMERVSANPPDN